MTHTCSVIILNYNGEEMLRRYLPSVVKYSEGTGIQIIVADNGSSDSSLDVVRQFPTVQTIIFPTNYGFAEGYNQAIERIDSEYTILLNSDVEVTPHWLTTLLTYMNHHPEVTACQPKVLSWLRKTHFEHAGAAGGQMDYLGYPFCRGRLLDTVAKDRHQYDSPTPIFWATGACLCIRTKSYKEAGGLDKMFFAHQEEIDLCWRLLCRGGQIHAIPESVVYHLGGGALHYDSPRKTYLNFRNNLLMLYKNLPTAQLIKVMCARFVLDYVAMLNLLIHGHASNAKEVIHARWDFFIARHHTYFRQRRKENLSLATIPYPKEIYPHSILWEHYVLHRMP